MFDLRPYLRRPVSTGAAIVREPVEQWLRFREQLAAHREGATPPDLYRPVDDWEDRLRVLGVAPPASTAAEFWALWHAVIAEMSAKGIRCGPLSFKGWNDGDAALVRAIWLLVRHLRPSIVIETGVAHGVTSRFVLEALHKNGCGYLWSIDRPPLEREWEAQIGIAVPDRLRHRWTYIRGSSRRRLPALLSHLGRVDLFIHDSLHSERNVRFEMDRAWAALQSGGAIVVDDIDVNYGFRSFIRSWSGHRSLVCESEPLRADPRRHNNKGMFAIVLKSPGGRPGPR